MTDADRLQLLRHRELQRILLLIAEHEAGVRDLPLEDLW